MRVIITLAAFATLAVACNGRPQEAQPVAWELLAPGNTPQGFGASALRGASTAQEKSPAVNPDAQILVDFKARIDKYVALHKDAKKGVSMKTTSSPAEIQAEEEAVAARIRAMRVDAKPGDIFTPAIRDKFRRLLYPEQTKGGDDNRDAKAVLKEDAPSAASFPFKVNAKYPEGAPLPTVPINLLMGLPTLPEEVEYRIIDKHLILRDTAANIIVDYMANVIR